MACITADNKITINIKFLLRYSNQNYIAYRITAAPITMEEQDIQSALVKQPNKSEKSDYNNT